MNRNGLEVSPKMTQQWRYIFKLFSLLSQKNLKKSWSFSVILICKNPFLISDDIAKWYFQKRFKICGMILIKFGPFVRQSKNLKKLWTFSVILISKNPFLISDDIAIWYFQKRFKIRGIISIKFGPFVRQSLSNGNFFTCIDALKTSLILVIVLDSIITG